MAEYLYSKDHVWVLKKDDEVFHAGITDFAQQELGEIVYIELPSPGKSFSAGDVLCSLDSLKSSSEIYAPVSGEIVEINQKLTSEETMKVINSDPMGEGWLFAFRVRAQDELSGLMNEKEYRTFIEE